MMNTIIKKNQNTTQAVISTDNNFILARTIKNFTDVISPFRKVKNANVNYISDFKLPNSQIHRIQTLYDTISLSQYTVRDDNIIFDCVSALPDDCFGKDVEFGYIHFSIKKGEKQKDRAKETYLVEPLVVFESTEFDFNQITFDQEIKFKSDFLKAFPIILKSGFMLSTVNKTECQLFISVINPSKYFIGQCSKFEIVNVIQYLLPLWQIFRISIDKNINIYFQESFLKDVFKNETKPILLYIKYEFEDPTKISFGKFGKYINVDIPEKIK